MASTAIFANPGQTVRLAVQTVDGYGTRVDGYVPRIESVYFPSLDKAAGYPQLMSNLETGLYIHGLELPTGETALGTFVVSVFYQRPGTNAPVWELFTIQVARPFGNTTVAPA
jgi:hypothetical protein